MSAWSLIPAFILFGLAIFPAASLSSPVMLGTLAWALLWLLNALVGFGFAQSSEVLVYVLIGNLMFYLGGIIATAGWHPPPLSSLQISARREHLALGLRSRQVIAWLLVLISIIAMDNGMREMGNSSGILSFASAGQDQFFEMLRLGKASLSEDGEWAIPRGITVATAALCAAGILVGIDLKSRETGRSPTRSAVLAVAVGLATFVLSAGTGVRGLLIVVGFLLLGGYLAAEAFCTGGRNAITRRVVGWLGISVVGFLVWVVVVQSARLQDSSFSNVGQTLDHLRPWFAGYIPALSQWYELHFSSSDLTWGSTLMRSIAGPLGLASGEGFDAQVGFVWIADGISSNAMTIYRVLWSDFGVVGGAGLSMIAGFAAQFIYRRAVERSGIWLPLLAAAYASVLYSINYWFFGYGARVLALAIVVAVFIFTAPALNRRNVRRERPSQSSRALYNAPLPNKSPLRSLPNAQ